MRIAAILLAIAANAAPAIASEPSDAAGEGALLVFEQRSLQLGVFDRDSVQTGRFKVKLQFLGGAKWRDSFAWCDSLRMDVDIAHTALTATAVDSLHNIGLKVNCWTVDKPERAAELIEYGVDMITTNSLPVSK